MVIQDRAADGRAVSGLPSLLNLSFLGPGCAVCILCCPGGRPDSRCPGSWPGRKSTPPPRWHGGRFRLCGMAPCSTGQKYTALLYCFAVVHSNDAGRAAQQVLCTPIVLPAWLWCGNHEVSAAAGLLQHCRRDTPSFSPCMTRQTGSPHTRTCRLRRGRPAGVDVIFIRIWPVSFLGGEACRTQKQAVMNGGLRGEQCR